MYWLKRKMIITVEYNGNNNNSYKLLGLYIYSTVITLAKDLICQQIDNGHIIFILHKEDASNWKSKQKCEQAIKNWVINNKNEKDRNTW